MGLPTQAVTGPDLCAPVQPAPLPLADQYLSRGSAVSIEIDHELDRALHEEREAALLRLVGSFISYFHLHPLPLSDPINSTADGIGDWWAPQDSLSLGLDQLTTLLSGLDQQMQASYEATVGGSTSRLHAAQGGPVADLSPALAAAAGEVRAHIRDVELAFTPPGQLWAVSLGELLTGTGSDLKAKSRVSTAGCFADGEGDAGGGQGDEEDARSDAMEGQEVGEDEWPTDMADPDLSAGDLDELLADLPVIDVAVDVPRCAPVRGECSQEQWLLLGDGEGLGARVRQRADIETYVDLGHGPVCLQGTRTEVIRWLLQAAAVMRFAPGHGQVPTNEDGGHADQGVVGAPDRRAAATS